jgi:hypothetical protein
MCLFSIPLPLFRVLAMMPTTSLAVPLSLLVSVVFSKSLVPRHAPVENKMEVLYIHGGPQGVTLIPNQLAKVIQIYQWSRALLLGLGGIIINPASFMDQYIYLSRLIQNIFISRFLLRLKLYCFGCFFVKLGYI